MEIILVFVANYYSYIIAVLIAIIGVLFFGKKKALAIAYSLLEQYKDVLIHKAESNHEVYAQFIYDHVPAYLRVFLTKKVVDAIVVDFIKLIELHSEEVDKDKN